MSAIHIKNLLTFDIYGNVEPISIEQILDKDVLELYTRDYSQDKKDNNYVVYAAIDLMNLVFSMKDPEKRNVVLFICFEL